MDGAGVRITGALNEAADRMTAAPGSLTLTALRGVPEVVPGS